MRIEKQIEALNDEKTKKEAQRPAGYKHVLASVKYFLKNLDQLLIKQIDPIKKARLFAIIFNQVPTYDDLDYGTQKTPLFTGVNSVFRLASLEKSLLVTSRRI